MQTERVTFLTTPDHKAALDAFARESGMSVGHVAREATSRFIVRESDREEELNALVDEVEAAIPQMRQDMSAMLDALRSASAEIEAYRREKAQRS